MKYTFEVFCALHPGVTVMALYGTLHQLRRVAIYNEFCNLQHAVLFATDIAARGLGENNEIICYSEFKLSDKNVGDVIA